MLVAKIDPQRTGPAAQFSRAAVGASPKAPRFSVRAVAFNPVGQSFALGGRDPCVVIRKNVEPEYAVEQILSWTTDTVSILAFSEHGNHLASASERGAVKIWDAKTWRDVASLSETDARVSALAFSPDERYLAVGKEDGEVSVWDIETKTECFLVKSGNRVEDLVSDLAFSPDGSQLVGGNADGMLTIWQMTDGTELVSWKGHTSPVMKVFFKKESLVSCSWGGEVLSWHLPHLREALKKMGLDW